MAKQYPDKLIYADSRAFIHCFHNVVIKCNNLEAARMNIGQMQKALWKAREKEGFSTLLDRKSVV